jgi:hypothetical protein
LRLLVAAKHCVYFLVDGIHVQARLEDCAQCLLVEGKKELVGLIDGVRESARRASECLPPIGEKGHHARRQPFSRSGRESQGWHVPPTGAWFRMKRAPEAAALRLSGPVTGQ